LFSEKREIEAEEEGFSGRLLIDETMAIIRKVCEATKSQMLPKYVEKGKVDENDFEKYFTVIEGHLSGTIMGDGEGSNTFYEGLGALSPGLTYEEYHKKHRNTIEYLFRLVRKRTMSTMREWYGSDYGQTRRKKKDTITVAKT
jgi:hypothetical protein